MLEPQVLEGRVADGTKYLVVVPQRWNEKLLLYSHGPVVLEDAPAWPSDLPIIRALLERGFAVAGCGTTVFYPLKENVSNQVQLLELFQEQVGRPTRTIAWGESIGGLMTAALVQAHPGQLDGALPLCGPLAGGVATWNEELDVAFVFKSLLAPDADIDVVNVRDPERNLQTALSVLHAAQESAQGRARIALAAAVANIPGWFDPATPEPPADDYGAQQQNQFEWMRSIDLMVFLSARKVLEQRAGGNGSWNDDVDYGDLLARSWTREQVNRLYDIAGLKLDQDLDTLANARRISPDPAAVQYFTEHVTFTGDLADVPVVTVHTVGDGLAPVDHSQAYGDVVQWAGHSDLLCQLYIHRGGHCSYTPAEVLAAIDVLEQRLDSGEWPDVSPDALNGAASELGPALNHLSGPVGSVDLDRSSEPADPAFRDFDPPQFLRPFDGRQVTT